jgi:hypothetical protein
MGFHDMFHFDEAKYKIKVHNFDKARSYQELASRERAKRRRLVSTKARIWVTIGLLLPTGGATGFGLFMAMRQRNVAKKKYKHIVAAMHAHGHDLPVPKMSDTVVPILITLTIYTLTLGLLYGLDEFGEYASQEILNSGMQTTGNIVSDTVTSEGAQFISDPTTFAHGFAHGAEAQLDYMHAVVSPHETIVQAAAHMATPTAGEASQYASGAMAGFQYAPGIEESAVGFLATQGMERGSKKQIEKETAGHLAVKNMEAATKRRPLPTIHRVPVGSKTRVIITESEISKVALA